MDKNLQTAQVDVRRLQLLNDRICQTLDALNQVRMSAGFSHSNPFVGGYNYGVQPFYNQGFGYSAPYGAINTPVQNFVDPRMTMGTGFGYGLSHSNPYQTNSFIPTTPVHGWNNYGTFNQTPAYYGAPTTSFYGNPVELERARWAGINAPVAPISIW